MAVLYSDKWKIENVEAVLFDKDGTFVDSDIYWGKLGEMRIRAVLKEFSLSDVFFNHLASVIGLDSKTGKLITNGPLAILPRNDVIQILTDELVKNNNVKTDTVQIAKIFESVHKEFLDKMFEYTYLLDGAIEIFERLKAAGIKMAVVTSDTYSHTIETLKYLNIENFFDEVIGCDSLNYSKKTGQPALFALDRMGIKPSDTIVIGDAQMDAQMADNGGLKASILVTTGQVPKEELMEYSSFVIDNLAEIKVSG